MMAVNTIVPITPPTHAPAMTLALTDADVSLLEMKMVSCPTVNSVSPNWPNSPDAAALFRRETTSAGLGCAPPSRTNPNSMMTLPSVTEIITS